jgi:hypothetical protein
MTSKDKRTKAVEEFFRRVKEEGQLPDDLSVSKYSQWTGTGLEPVPCHDYRLEYEGRVREEAERLRAKDASLQALLGSLDFALDQESQVLRVFRLVEWID